MTESNANLLDIILKYYTLLRRYLWLIVITTGAVTLAVTLFALLTIVLPPKMSPLPNFYTADAILFVSTNEDAGLSESILSALGATLQSRETGSFNNGDMLLEILHSRTIMDRLISEFDIMRRYGLPENKRTQARQRLLGNFSFFYSRNTGSLRIAFVDTDPAFARDVVNKTVDHLNEWFVQNKGLAKQKTKLILEQKLREVQVDINELQSRLKDLQQKYGVLNAEELSVSQATSLANLRSQLIMKEIEIKNYSVYAQISDPRLEQLNDELQNLRDLIRRNQTAVPAITTGDGKSLSLADVAQEFSRLTNELDIQQRIYNTLSPQYEAMKLNPESEPIFEVFELAEIPDVKTGPRRSRFVLLAMVGSFGFSIALALGMNTIGEWKKDYVSRKNAGLL